MSTSSQILLRVRRSDQDASDGLPLFSLLSISSVGRKPLDIKILATEGENAFVATLNNDKINSLKEKTYSGSNAEWESILSKTLLHVPITDTSAALEGLELVSSISNNETLILTWQKKKPSTTQNLGSLSLRQTDDEQIDPYIWAGDALQTSESFQTQLADERAITAKLREQLQTLVESKESYEKALLSKFTELLNSKKLKIRDQQRILAGSTINPQAIEQVTSSEDRDVTAASRKRTAENELSSDDDDSDAFEDTSMKDPVETPQASDEDSTGDEREPTPPPKPVVRRVIGGAKSKQAASSSTKSPAKSSTRISPPAGKSSNKAERGPSEEAAQPPPKRRELPFQRKTDPLPTVTSSPDTKPMIQEDSDTEEEL